MYMLLFWAMKWAQLAIREDHSLQTLKSIMRVCGVHFVYTGYGADINHFVNIKGSSWMSPIPAKNSPWCVSSKKVVDCFHKSWFCLESVIMKTWNQCYDTSWWLYLATAKKLDFLSSAQAVWHHMRYGPYIVNRYMWPSQHKPPIYSKYRIYITWVWSSIAGTWTSIVCATSNFRNNWMHRTARDYVVDIAWQSLLYSLYSTKPKGATLRVRAVYAILHTTAMLYMYYIPKVGRMHIARYQQTTQPINACSNTSRQRCVYISPAQCSNKNQSLLSGTG